ncbi:nucleotidyltransferase family protein [Rhodobacteraceae bacterium]|nr:nucleotidyltransferase family protein [Paracoccaceae bacterium]
MIVTFIPAAGQSSRMAGRDKLLETIDGTAILRRTALTTLAAGLGPVCVGIDPDNRLRRKVLEGLDVTILNVPNAHEGMSASLRIGAKAALKIIQSDKDEHTGMMILLPDMPDIDTKDLTYLNNAFKSSGGTAIRATTTDNLPGHPVIFPTKMLTSFKTLTGDKGAARLLTSETCVQIALPGNRATQDLDTPEAWAAWRKSTKTTL